MSDNAERHPFLTGLSKHRGAPATCLVIFGASGDLASRKLIPALFNLGVDNLLPADFTLIGYGRKPIADEAFRKSAASDIARFSRRPMREDIWNRVEQKTYYQAGGYDDLASFEALRDRIDALQAQSGREWQLVFYVSTPPGVFADIITNLGKVGLAKRGAGTDLETKVIIEKPFGKDLGTARELNDVIKHHWQERQVYRIDHYLGKETVQDLLVLRFANSIFEPLWNRNYVDHVQITVAEELGVGTRGGYYDTAGAARDMLQNHTMQLLSLVAMEPPVSLDGDDIRDEKVKLIKAIRPLSLDPANPDFVRAQYAEGLVAGEKVPGYMQEQDIPSDSSTETYAALRFNINNWRWAGVPFYMRSGKRMARRVTEIAIQFKSPVGGLFSSDTRYDLAPNRLVIQIQPDEGTTLTLNSKVPGLEPRTQPVKMSFRYATTYGSNTPEAYERLILDGMVGDRTLFIRGDEAESSWKLFTPLLEHWKANGRRGVESYASGSWGPLAADRLLWDKKHEWRNAGR